VLAVDSVTLLPLLIVQIVTQAPFPILVPLSVLIALLAITVTLQHLRPALIVRLVTLSEQLVVLFVMDAHKVNGLQLQPLLAQTALLENTVLL
jgi:hypothetical protein